MTNLHNKKAQAFRGSAAIATAALALLALFGITACSNNAGGNTGSGKSGGGGINKLTPRAVLTIRSDTRVFKVRAKTADNSSVWIENGFPQKLASDTESDVYVSLGTTTVILKGNITELKCDRYLGDDSILLALNVQSLPDLQKLECCSTALTALNAQGCTALKELKCNMNRLTDLNVKGCTSLQKLECCDNRLSFLDVRGCTSLQRLDCYNNQLTALDVRGCTSLQRLDCYNNQLTALYVQGCTALQRLDCYNNQLSSLDVRGCTALQELHCDSNQLAALNVQGLTDLRFLSCTRNQFTAEAFTNLLTDLPMREEKDDAKCVLYSMDSGVTEDNHKDFTSASAPQELKEAFNKAKNEKKWKMMYLYTG